MKDRGWSNERRVQRTTGLAGAVFWLLIQVRDKHRSLASYGSNHWTYPRDCFVAAKRRNNSLPDETISCFGADFRKQRMVIKPTRNGGQHRHEKQETVKSGPSASSWPSRSVCPPPWPVCRTAFRASAPSHTTALPLSLPRPRLSWLRPTNSQLQPRKLPVRPSCFFLSLQQPL